MRILSTSSNFLNTTGMPMYIYNLGKEVVAMGHEFVVTAGKVGDPMAALARAVGITVLQPDEVEGDFDMILAQEVKEFNLFSKFPYTPAYCLIHSMTQWDEPMGHPSIIGYLAPREQVAEYWRPVCGAITILPIPIDFERFTPVEAKNDGFRKILVPCTSDWLRMPMFMRILELAEKDPSVIVRQVGDWCGALGTCAIPQNFTTHPATLEIEKEMAWADEVHGIYIGTVTLEAWAMGKKTVVYDEKGEYQTVHPYDNFRELHDAKNVAKKLISLA